LALVPQNDAGAIPHHVGKRYTDGAIHAKNRHDG
jgi:hypothetical protein